jgi:histidinol-phosphate/aromatic aminotransferase/cobyric acid decarboxylase-like protein
MVVPFWAVVEEKSLSLREAEARKLQNALRAHLAVAESGEAGNFLLIRVAEGTAQLGAHDPAQVAAALMKVLVHRRIQRIHKSR